MAATTARARIVLRGGDVVDGSGREPFRADVAVENAEIVAVGEVGRVAGEQVVDCSDRYVLPGLIDAHSHADGAIFAADVAEALLRQGVTSVIAGQDGVSYAPGDGRYATEYFAALNGPHPTYAGGGVAALLRSYDRRTSVNVGYLIPQGTVRHEVMGFADRPPTAPELTRMTALVTQGLTEGALGASTGLDYAPGYFADTEELVTFCRPLARAGALYVTHMRGGYEHNAPAGVSEVAAIARGAGVAAHISHLHGPTELLTALIDEERAAGVDLSFDAYPYRRGCSLLAMPMLPASLLRLGSAGAAAALADPAVRERLRQEWVPVLAARPDMGADWASGATIAHVAAPAYRWTEGLTIRQAATASGLDPAEIGYRMLADSMLAVSAVFAVPTQRPVDELAALFRHDAHVGGSDGIYVGRHPHPRGWGCFARYLGLHTRTRGDYTWAQAAVHLSGRTAARYRLADRGQIRARMSADLIVVDPSAVADNATYEDPTALASGIDDVLVNGELALRHGELTGIRSGRGLRRTTTSN